MAILTPPPKFSATFVDSDGFTKPAVGYKLYTYTAGTTTPKASYTDITLGSSNTNPVVLDARGEASVWLNGAYKLVLKTDTDSTIWTVDEVRDLTSDGIFVNATLNGTLTISSTAVTWSGNPTHSGNHTFTNNVTVKGNTQLGDQSSDTLRIDPNTVTWTNNPTHSGNHTWSGNQTVSGTATFNGAVTLGDATADTITVNGSFANRIADTTYASTPTGQVNVAATSAASMIYIRIGDSISFSGQVTVDPTAGNAGTELTMTIPIASDFSQSTDAQGVAVREDSTSAISLCGYIYADTTLNHLRLRFYCDADAASRVWHFSGHYRVL